MPESSNHKNENRNRNSILCLALILVLAALLRFAHLGGRPLYGDEPWATVKVASQTIPFILEHLYGSMLYTLILHVILPLGDTVVMARLPAAVFGLLSVLVAFLVAKRLFGKTEGLIAALFLALSAHALFFSQQARGYSGLQLFSLLSLYLLIKAEEDNRLISWTIYAAALATGAYMHFFSLILIPTHGLYLGLLWIERILARGKQGEAGKAFARIAAFTVSMMAVLSVTFILYSHVADANDYFSRSSKGLSNIRMAIDLTTFTADTLKRILVYQESPAFFYFKLALALAGAAACIKNRKKELLLLLTCLAFPFLLFSLSNPHPDFLPADNKFIFIGPLLFILMARGLVGGARAAGGLLSRTGDMTGRDRLASRLTTAGLILIVMIEGFLILSYRFYFWQLASTGPRGDLVRRLAPQLQDKYYALFADSIDKSCLASLAPLIYPDGRTRGLMLAEDESWMGADLLLNKGLWVFTRKNPKGWETARKLSRFSDKTRIEELSKILAVRFDTDDGLLRDKLLHAVHVLAEAAQINERRIYNLLGTKIRLAAEGHPDAILDFFTEAKTRSAESSATALKTRTSYRSPLTTVESRLVGNISDIVLEKSGSLDRRGLSGEALSLVEAGLSLDPGHVGLLITAAGIQARAGCLDESMIKSVRILESTAAPDDLMAAMRFLRDLPDMNPAIVIWRNDHVWRIRWWTDRPRSFSGRIESPHGINRVRETRPGGVVRWNLRDGRLAFEAKTLRDGFRGLDFTADPDAELVVHLRIEGLGDISRRVILGKERKARPDQIPFTLRCTD